MNMIDVYEEAGDAPNPKLVEAVGNILQTSDDPGLRARIDPGIDKLIDQVLPEGKPRKWKRLLNGEMYSAGHFMEAAVAYYTGTGDRKMLDVAIILADDIDNNFGPGKRLDISQHEEIKIGLLKLYHQTGEERYRDLARFFIDERGHSHNGRELYGEYAQDHMPVIDQEEVVGHTVRATYLYTPLAELAALTGEPAYKRASSTLWEDAVYRKTYITGSIGTYRDHEDFGAAYELPNISCWNETCASIGSIFWNYQLFSLNGDAKYIDMIEKILYNGFLSGISLDGSEYFYQNPLKSYGDFERHPWFGPNCCPPNDVRLISSLGKYIYAKTGNDIYVNLFIGSRLDTELNGNRVAIQQETAYPWDGKVKISVEPEDKADFAIYIRIPGWATGEAMPGDLYSFADTDNSAVSLKVNGKTIKVNAENGFVAINRGWNRGDVIELDMPMNPRKVVANENVADDAGRVALQRGPIIYCAEGIDNNGKVMNMFIPGDSEFEAIFTGNSNGGLVTLTGKAMRVEREKNGKGSSITESSLTAVPYFYWANRDAGEMQVWMAGSEQGVETVPAPTIASTSRVTSSCGSGTIADNYPGGDVPAIATRFYPTSQSGSAGFSALYDQLIPVNSFDGSSTYLSLRPQSGDRAWVQYDFIEAATIQSVDVYWKDDKQYCQVPESWELFYRDGDRWVPVNNLSEYTVDKDQFNTLTFEPVTTDALKLDIRLRGLDFRMGELGPPDGNYMPTDITWYETGIIEWRVSN